MDTINVINRPGDRLPKRCLITFTAPLVLVILYHILILKGTNSQNGSTFFRIRRNERR